MSIVPLLYIVNVLFIKLYLIYFVGWGNYDLVIIIGKIEDKDFRRAVSDSTNYDYFIFVNFDSYFLVKPFLID